jgi:hypothetical protein
MSQGHDYPFYAEPPNDRHKVTLYFAILSFLVCAAGYAIYHRNLSEIMQWKILFASTPLLLYGFFNWLFDRFLWKTSLGVWSLRLLQIPVPPRIEGRYKTRVTWHEPNAPADKPQNGESDAVMTIVQSWRRLSVVFVFLDAGAIAPRATSTSRMALLEETADGRVLLNYLYEYRGTSSREDGRGVKQFRISGTCYTVFYRESKDSPWSFHGDYYSDDGGSGLIKQVSDLIDPSNMPGKTLPSHEAGPFPAIRHTETQTNPPPSPSSPLPPSQNHPQ